MSAIVTLAALTEGIEPNIRRIHLDSTTPNVQVGRSSKSAWKNFRGDVDNAWFDSPVMSRDHAKFSLVEDEAGIHVFVEDIGSMHGTFLKERLIARGTPVILSDGDIVTFGAEVRRNMEVFPACSFVCQVEFTKSPPSRTFSVPDSSDDESSGDESVVFQRYRAQPQPIDLTDDASGSERTSKGAVVIDSDDSEDSDDDLESITSDFPEIPGHRMHSPSLEVLDHDPAVDEEGLVSKPPSTTRCDKDAETAASPDFNDSDIEDEHEGENAQPTSYCFVSDEGEYLDDEEGLDSLDESDCEPVADAPAQHRITTQREPSPSDAAMVKSIIPPADVLITPPSFTNAGKESFFQARKLNRSAIEEKLTLPPLGSAVCTNSLQYLSDMMDAGNHGDASKQKEFIETRCGIHADHMRQLTSGADSSDGEDQLMPDREPSCTVLPNLAEDFLGHDVVMAGAIRHNETKRFHKIAEDLRLRQAHFPEASDHSGNALENQDDATSSNLPTDKAFEVTSRPALPTPPALSDGPQLGSKRKYEDISDTVDEELLAWASGICAVENYDEHAVIPGSALSHMPPRKVTLINNTDEQRIDAPQPPKKMRRFIEAVSYAAIGGVAVGASVFTLLAATAPDFL